MASITIPITLTPEAAARVAELGMQAELEQMLEHARQTISGVRAIEVQEGLPYDTGDESRIVIEVLMDNPHLDHDPTETAWDRWVVTTFPPDVFRHFVLLSLYANP